MAEEERKLTEEELILNEYITAIMDNEYSLYTTVQLAKILGKSSAEIENALALFEPT